MICLVISVLSLYYTTQCSSLWAPLIITVSRLSSLQLPSRSDSCMSVVYVPERRILPHLCFLLFSGGSCDNSNCKLYGLNITKPEMRLNLILITPPRRVNNWLHWNKSSELNLERFEPWSSHSARALLSLFLTLPMDCGGMGSMSTTRSSRRESVAATAASQCLWSPSRSSSASSWRKVSLSPSVSSDQNRRTWVWPAASKPRRISSKQGIVREEATTSARNSSKCGPGHSEPWDSQSVRQSGGGSGPKLAGSDCEFEGTRDSPQMVSTLTQCKMLLQEKSQQHGGKVPRSRTRQSH